MYGSLWLKKKLFFETEENNKACVSAAWRKYNDVPLKHFIVTIDLVDQLHASHRKASFTA